MYYIVYISGLHPSRLLRIRNLTADKHYKNSRISTTQISWTFSYSEGMKSTHAAVAAKISTLFAFVNNPTTAANPTVKAATIPNLGPILPTK